MALYRATVLRTHKEGDVYIEKGMEVSFASFTPPWMVNQGQPIQEAFMRVYGVDLKKGFVCSPGFIEVVEVK